MPPDVPSRHTHAPYIKDVKRDAPVIGNKYSTAQASRERPSLGERPLAPYLPHRPCYLQVAPCTRLRREHAFIMGTAPSGNHVSDNDLQSPGECPNDVYRPIVKLCLISHGSSPTEPGRTVPSGDPAGEAVGITLHGSPDTWTSPCPRPSCRQSSPQPESPLPSRSDQHKTGTRQTSSRQRAKRWPTRHQHSEQHRRGHSERVTGPPRA